MRPDDPNSASLLREMAQCRMAGLSWEETARTLGNIASPEKLESFSWSFAEYFDEICAAIERRSVRESRQAALNSLRKLLDNSDAQVALCAADILCRIDESYLHGSLVSMRKEIAEIVHAKAKPDGPTPGPDGLGDGVPKRPDPGDGDGHVVAGLRG